MSLSDPILTAPGAGRADRRTFLRGGAVLGATLAAAAAGSPAAMAKVAGAFGPIDRDAVTPGDIAILKFLAAAELLEDDLWQQYCELAVANPSYNKALRRIDTAVGGLVAIIAHHPDMAGGHLELGKIVHVTRPQIDRVVGPAIG